MAIEKAIDKLEAEKTHIMNVWLRKREEQLQVNKTFNFVRWNDLEQECQHLAECFNSKNKQLEPLKQHLESIKLLKQKEELMEKLMTRLRHLEGKKAQEEFFSAKWKAYAHDISQVQETLALVDQELQRFTQKHNTAYSISN